MIDMAERRGAKISAAWKRIWHPARSQPSPAVQLPSLLHRRNTPTPSTSSSLITFIRKGDDLPQQWMLSKRKKHSAGDIQELGEYLEHMHGISRISLDVRRPSSAGLATPSHSEADFFHWKAMEPLDDIRSASEPADVLGHSFNTDRPAHTASTKRVTMARNRHGIDSATMTDPCLRQSRVREDFRLPTMLSQIRACGAFLLRLLQVIGRILSLYMTWAWFVMRWPICIVLAGWLFLQGMVMAYTFTSNVFLSGFCQYRLPIVRNWMCSSWDEFADYRYSDSAAENINQPFDNILQSSEKTMSYKLPFFITRYQTTVRFFRVSLPESEYAPQDQLFFQFEFAEFIDLSNHTIVSAQLFHAHIVGTINSHVLDTNYVVQKLEDNNYLSSMVLSTGELLQQGMLWLDYYHLIYLPAGMEPFQERAFQTHHKEALKLMEEHVRNIVHRLLIDLDLILILQNSLWSLEQSSESIAARISQCKRNNKLEDFQRGNKRLLWMKETLFGQKFESYQIDQRSKWVGTMEPVFQEAATFLSHAALQLNTAHLACQQLLERLAYEGRAARYGREMPAWVKEQAKELGFGIENIEAQLKAFKLEQLRFDERVFSHAQPSHEAADQDNLA